MALACGVRTSLTSVLNSSIMASETAEPFSLARDFCSEPRWSMAAAAITPCAFETAFIPASLPGATVHSPCGGASMNIREASCHDAEEASTQTTNMLLHIKAETKVRKH